jgi:hypothetical protein
MASEAPTEAYGRGMRGSRRSQRGKDADLVFTGLQDLRESSTSLDPPVPQMQPATPATPHKPHSIYATPLSRLKGAFPMPQNYRSKPHTPHSIYAPYLPMSRDAALSIMAHRDITGGGQDADRVMPAFSGLSIGSGAQQILPSIEARDHDASGLPSLGAVDSATGSGATSMQPSLPSSYPPMSSEQSEYQPRKTAADSAQPTARANRVTKPQKSRKKKPTKKAAAEASSRKRQPATPENSINSFKTQDPLLQPAKLQVYNWDHPIPTDFLNLPDEVKAAKARVDALMGQNDLDPELDDWHEFCGLESTVFNDLPLKSSVGLNFISRAKRAYRAGRTWMSFETEELAIDSRAGARALKDAGQREIALSSSLSNTLRLYVFEQLKVRLCHEIWLQPYPEGDNEVSMRDSAIGTAAPTPAPSDMSAVDLAMKRMEALPDRLRTMVPGTAPLVRTRPELPGVGREVHQPEGPRVRATQTNMRGLGMRGRDGAMGLHLDMATSEEE